MGFLTENEMEKRLPMAESDCRDVGRFLNRILGLQVVLQNMASDLSVLITIVIIPDGQLYTNMCYAGNLLFILIIFEENTENMSAIHIN